MENCMKEVIHNCKCSACDSEHKIDELFNKYMEEVKEKDLSVEDTIKLLTTNKVSLLIKPLKPRKPVNETSEAYTEYALLLKDYEKGIESYSEQVERYHVEENICYSLFNKYCRQVLKDFSYEFSDSQISRILNYAWDEQHYNGYYSVYQLIISLGQLF